MTLYRRLLGYLRPHAGVFGISIVAMIVYAALDAFSLTLLIPFTGVLFGADAALGVDGGLGEEGQYVTRFLDGVMELLAVPGNPMAGLRNVVLALFVVFLVKNIALYVQQYSVAVVQGRVIRDLRDDIYRNLLRLGFGYFQRMRTGQVISRATADVDQVRTVLTENLARALSAIIQVVFLITFLVGVSWKLTLVALLSLPPMLGMWARFRKRLRAGVLRVLDAVGEVASHIQETVAGIRLVKAAGAEEWELRRFQALTRGHYKAFVRNARWRQFFPPVNEMVIATAVLGLLWFGSFLVLEDRSLSAGAFIGALALALKLMAPAKFLGQYPTLVQPGLAAAERAFEIIDAPADIVERPDARPVSGFRDAIRFENVSFSYPGGPPVLRELDLSIGAGEVVAVVGPSGAGKSTLSDLLPRFQDPSSGRITLDGVDLRDLRLAELRGLLGIVTQETILFHDTVRANIAYAVERPSDADVEAAARVANAHGFIAELPEGYDTVLGERGTRLSGGQRQRIAIARALFRNPPILILDEATSALDTESERLVQEAIEGLMRDRTVLVIAHRLSTVRRADRIVVMEAGRIVETGTHAELLAASGLYRRLYEMQFETAPSDAPDGVDPEHASQTA